MDPRTRMTGPTNNTGDGLNVSTFIYFSLKLILVPLSYCFGKERE